LPYIFGNDREYPKRWWGHVPTVPVVPPPMDPADRLEAADVLYHPWILKHTSADDSNSVFEARIPEVPSVETTPASPNSLRKALSISLMFPLTTSKQSTTHSDQILQQPGVKASAKFRRQSSVVTSFCQPPREDMLCRCEL